MKFFISKNKFFTVFLSILLLASTITIPFNPEMAEAISFSTTTIENPEPQVGGDFGFSLTKLPGEKFAVGAPGNNGGGKVYVYGGDGILDCTINPGLTGNERFGETLSSVGTSNLLAVGVPGIGSGQIRIYNSNTCAIVNTISNPGTTGTIGQDKISSFDDDEILAGVTDATVSSLSNAGTLYRINVNTGSSQTITAGPQAEQDGFFGSYSTVVSSSKIVVGSYGADRAFVINPSTGATLDIIENNQGGSGDKFGWSTTTIPGSIVISAIDADSTAGSFYLYSDSGSHNFQSTQFNPLSDPGDSFGYWVASVQGKVLAGAPFDDTDGNDGGIAHLYTGTPSISFNQALRNPNVTPDDDLFGFSVDILNVSGLDNLIIGAPGTEVGATNTAGVVYYFVGIPGVSAKVTVGAIIGGNLQTGQITVNESDIVDYRFIIENDGVSPFDLLITSGPSGSPSCPSPLPLSGADGFLIPGETEEYGCIVPAPASSFTEGVTIQFEDQFDFFTWDCTDPEISCNDLDVVISNPVLTIVSGSQTPDPVSPNVDANVSFTVKNDGNTAISDVTVTTDDPKPGSPNCSTATSLGDGFLAIGESEVFTCQTSSPATIPLTVFAQGNDRVTPPGTVLATPLVYSFNVGFTSMDISSSVAEFEPIPEDDPINVTFTVKNDGTLTLTGVTVGTNDPKPGFPNCFTTTPLGDGIIAPGDSEDFVCTTSNPNPGTFALLATGNSNQISGITHLKNILIGTTEMSMTGDFTPPNPIPENDPITVTFEVFNDGTLDLSNVSVTTDDPQTGSGPSDCTNTTPSSANIPVGFSQIFTCTTDFPDGSITLTGTATADDPLGNPLTPVTLPLNLVIGAPGLTLSGIATNNPSPPSGTDVTFTVKNNGMINLENVQVTTDGPGTCPTPTPQGDGNIPVGESETFTCNTGPITTDILITATATADDEFGNPITPVQNQLTIQITAPSVLITPNSVPPSPILPGFTATFDWAVSNTGNVPVIVTDNELTPSPLCDGGGLPNGPNGDTNLNNILDIGEIWTWDSCDITFDTITYPAGTTALVSASLDGTDPFGESQFTESSDIPMIIAKPEVGLTISADPSLPQINEDVTLTFTVENTGNVDLDTPILTLLSPFPSTIPPISSCNDSDPILLSPGETFDFTCIVQFTTSGTNSINAQVEISTSDIQLGGIVLINSVNINLDVSEPVEDVTLVSIIRDFKQDHPDMEQGCSGGICSGVETGLVQNTLGLDGNPVFNEDISSTNGPVNFNQWYNPVTGINQCTDYNMVLIFDETSGKYTFADGGIPEGFFPIDNQLFGNEAKPHNYHFTMESKATFEYQPGLYFEINGADDDTFVFINGKLVIDLGGTHPQNQAIESINLDDPMLVSDLGLVVGEEATFDLFFAERQTTGSHLLIETNIPFTGVNQGECDAPANSAELSITKTGELVSTGPSTMVLERTIIQGSDDAEQDKNDMDLDSSDLDLNEKDYVGLRFQNIDIPKGATITNAYVKFTVEDQEGDTGKAEVRIYAEDTDNASTFTNSKKDISSRKTTSAKVDWDIPNWNSAGQSGAAQTTPNISALIQEVIDRNGWQDGNSIALIFDSHKGNNDRDAKAYDSYPTMSALFVVEFESDSIMDSNLVYTVTITNNGPENANDVIVIDDLPEEVTAINVLPSECEIVDDHTVTCDFSTLSVGQDKTITIVTEVESGFTGTVTNNASVSSSKLDPYLGNNQVSLQTTIGGTAELFCGQPKSFYDKVIYGTESADKLKGTNGNDLIFGLGGPDKIHGYKGNDCIYGGSGNDKIYGHNGMDTIFGEEGNDRIYGNNDDDVLSGGEGRDYLRGGYGVDQISGGSDRDNIRGGQGDDSLSGDSGNDNIHGGSGDDFIDGGADTDLCKGGSGSNTIINCEQDDKKKDKDEDDDD